MKSWIVILLAIIGFQNCAPSRVIKPLEIGEQSVSMSLGGPMAKIPGVATLPIPFTNLSYARGCKENLTLTGSIYPTTMLFGTYQFDLGVNYGFIKQENWGISSTLLFNQAFDQWQRNYKIWPNLDINAYYELKKETASFCFTGVSIIGLSSQRLALMIVRRMFIGFSLPNLGLHYPKRNGAINWNIK